MRIAAKSQVQPPATTGDARAWKTAQSFEAQFLKSMLEQAMSGLDGEGPLGGGGPGASAWRGFLVEEHARAMSARGGIGLAAEVYRAMKPAVQPTTGSTADVRA